MVFETSHPHVSANMVFETSHPHVSANMVFETSHPHVSTNSNATCHCDYHSSRAGTSTQQCSIAWYRVQRPPLILRGELLCLATFRVWTRQRQITGPPQLNAPLCVSDNRNFSNNVQCWIYLKRRSSDVWFFSFKVSYMVQILMKLIRCIQWLVVKCTTCREKKKRGLSAKRNQRCTFLCLCVWFSPCAWNWLTASPKI